jgi:predicted DNA-binding protein with PD1-like motif
MLKGHVGKTCVARLSEGEDLLEGIRKRAEEAGIKAGVIILIGSLKDAVLGYYREGKYEYVRLNGPLEIASCTGNIALDEKGEAIVHAHVVVSNDKGEAFGGHLSKGSHVGVLAELVMIEASGIDLRRAFDPKTKLTPLRLG